MHYWLMKSEPESYSIDDLKQDKKTPWEGVRNYQARNFMREMKKGDLVLFYHSNITPPGVAGLGKVCREYYPDQTQWNKKSKYYDTKSSKENPRWFLVDVCFVKKFKKLITLDELKNSSDLKDMLVTRKGSRLSVQPVTEKHFKRIVNLSK